MDLKQIFITNLRKFRNRKGLSQTGLAELCGTSTNYIGEIEIGRRFPSLSLIEKLSRALDAEPYRFFMDETGDPSLDAAVSLMAQMPAPLNLQIIHRLSDPRGG
jgi:transcriptional regulator with XRE-family HTH domain